MDGFELEKIRNCRIILVVGPTGAGKTSLLRLLTGENVILGHKLDHGTILPTLIYGEINNESFAFLDSPGFGHAASQPGAVKRQIHAMLGHFTKEFGGIHGILYIQDILTERETPGMQEATYFLRELTGQDDLRSHITFITTKWDIASASPKFKRRCERMEADLIRSIWAGFRVGNHDGSRYVRHGIDCSEDDPDDPGIQQEGRQALLKDVMAYYAEQV